MKRLIKSLFSFCILFFFFSSQLFAQDHYLHGIIVNSDNKPVAGASVIIKGTASGTTTDANGVFTLKIGAEKKLTLIISFLGYSTKEIIIVTENKDDITIRLDEIVKTLDELIVTGVFDKRKRIESSIAITTIDSKVLDRIVPSSAVELLRQVPGVFTYTGRGEIYNSVVVRGMVLGGDYYYISMQEDGLPIISADTMAEAATKIVAAVK